MKLLLRTKFSAGRQFGALKLPIILTFANVMKRLIFILLLLPFALRAQQPAAELRGAWIATVFNNDFPSKPGLSPQQFCAEYDGLLDSLHGMGLNAVFVQVRSAGDAFYRSELAPWSAYLTGTQGKPPADNFDPMAYMVASAHNRQMAFHAWMNPFRAAMNPDTTKLSPTNRLRSLDSGSKSRQFFLYGNRWYFNPASDTVHNHLREVVLELITKYDIDGIHFDDYFYPYPIKGETLPDSASFAAQPHGFLDINDWRRDNVNRFVSAVAADVHTLKPHVRFGISPFGVWRNVGRDSLAGSPTRAGVTSYDDLFADVRLWLQCGWIDYVAPQLYWSIGYSPADYALVLDWWSRNTFGRNLYIGHAAYKVGNGGDDTNWSQPDQLAMQLQYNRRNPAVLGSIFFSAKYLLANPLGFRDTLRDHIYTKPVLIPPDNPKLPASLVLSPTFNEPTATRKSVLVNWTTRVVYHDAQLPYYFAVYRFNGKNSGDFNDAKNLLYMTPYRPHKWSYEDFNTQKGKHYAYVVVPYDRQNRAGRPSEPLVVKRKRNKVKLTH